MSYDPLRPLTDEETSAVCDYASKHGRDWKSKLRIDWYRARLRGTMHRLRNTHGPEWLDNYKLEK